MSKTEWSEAQLIQQEQIKQANAYARAVMEDPQARAIYDKIATQGDKPPYRMAFCDYFKGHNLLSANNVGRLQVNSHNHLGNNIR